jgi:hypothetical protein
MLVANASDTIIREGAVIQGVTETSPPANKL